MIEYDAQARVGIASEDYSWIITLPIEALVPFSNPKLNHTYTTQHMPLPTTIVAGPASCTRAKIAASLPPAFFTHSCQAISMVTYKKALAAMFQGTKVKTYASLQYKYPFQMLCQMANAVLDGEPGEIMEHRHLLNSQKYHKVWIFSTANKYGWLAQ